MQTDHKAFATLRFVGDELDPRVISAILPVEPTRAHRKGEEFFAGANAGNLPGRTGIWFLATDKLVRSNDLGDHLAFVQKLLYPEPGDDRRISKLSEIIRHTHSRAHVTCFWHGDPGEPPPANPGSVQIGHSVIGRGPRNRFHSRAWIDRIVSPQKGNVTIETLQRAAALLKLELVRTFVARRNPPSALVARLDGFRKLNPSYALQSKSANALSKGRVS